MKNKIAGHIAFIIFLILAISILPIAPSISIAQENETASSPAGGAKPIPAAGAAGNGGASSIGPLAKIGIIAASLGVVLILISSVDSTGTTPSH